MTAAPRGPSRFRAAVRRGAAGLSLLALAPLVTACGAGAVRVPVPKADAATVKLCEGLRLPATLHGLKRRDTTPESPLTAAWGDPAIALRCGVPLPSTYRMDEQLMEVNGLKWHGYPHDRPVTWTLLGRQAYVEVTIPPKYAPPGDTLIEIGQAVSATIPVKPENQI
ncbi:DUF3515 domain-containing protein [Actinomadura logoneensis]|uniref:DUF3515 domain-containing protein n=1 Tax=Actinomadura logoneensis TaxID=2293572 RepID=UPI001F47E220|nr:DUF3515 domain-containing protein [Actinomadura logoneensis]